MTDDPPIRSVAEQSMHSPPATDKQSPSDVPTHDPEEHRSLLQSRGAVLSFVFLVAGVVGLPLLWMNSNFSRGERVMWTVLVVLYSITLLLLAGGIMWWIYQLIVGI